MYKLLNKIMALSILTILLVPASAFAVDPPTNICGNSNNTAKSQVLRGVGETGEDCTGAGVKNIVTAIVQILSVVVGIAAVIMIIISGLKYVTSGGDSGGISSAKTTLVYALVGLAVAALAQVLVHFVLSTVSASDCTANPDAAVCATK